MPSRTSKVVAGALDATTAPEPLVVSVPTAARMLDLSPAAVWKMLYRGDIGSCKIGRQSRRIPISELRAYVAARTQGKREE